jgi:hypothetical protein
VAARWDVTVPQHLWLVELAAKTGVAITAININTLKKTVKRRVFLYLNMVNLL